MNTRAAARSDIERIAEFQLLMARETEGIELHLPTLLEGITAVFNEPSRGKYYVAEKDGKVIASLLTTYEWSDWRNGTVLWIQSVFVEKEFRRKGVYRNMYQYIQHMVLEDPRLKGIRLYADKSNEAAQETYRKLGMSPDHYTTFEWMK